MSFISGSNNLSDHLGTSSLIESVKHVLIYISFQTSKRTEREALTLYQGSIVSISFTVDVNIDATWRCLRYQGSTMLSSFNVDATWMLNICRLVSAIGI